MDHVQIKSNQIAASYVANGLDESTQEQFELHMLGCSDCLSDVEAWRAIKLHMPREAAPRTFISQRRNWWGGWGIAASVAAAALTAVSGWYAREVYQPDVETMHTAFFSRAGAHAQRRVHAASLRRRNPIDRPARPARPGGPSRRRDGCGRRRARHRLLRPRPGGRQLAPAVRPPDPAGPPRAAGDPLRKLRRGDRLRHRRTRRLEVSPRLNAGAGGGVQFPGLHQPASSGSFR